MLSIARYYIFFTCATYYMLCVLYINICVCDILYIIYMYILYLCVYIRDIYLRAVCSAAGTLLILGELAVYIYTYTCLSMSMYGLWHLFLYEVFEHVCSLQQFSPQPRETESLLVTFVTEVTLFWSRRVELGT